jgi:type IV secretory pathway TraG/TraD family ATPase VirD4
MEKQNSKANEEMVIGIIGLVAVLAVAKYLPIVAIGAIIGLISFWGSRPYQGIIKFCYYMTSTTFFSFIMWLMVGWPVRLEKGQIRGLFLSSDIFKSIINSIAAWWNSGVGSIAKGLVFNVNEITYLEMSKYFWSAFIPALLIVIGMELYCWLRNKGSFVDEWKTNPFSYPVILTNNCVGFIMFKFAYIGERTLVLFDNITKNVLVIVFGHLILFLIPHFLNTWLETKLSNYQDVLNILIFYNYFPVMGFFYGSIMESFKIVTGEEFNFFQKKRISEGFTLGTKENKRQYILSEKNLSYHVEMIAPTGSGKTNLLKNLILNRIESGHGVIFLDFKADFEVVDWMMGVTKHFNRINDFRLISLSDRYLSVPYNPMKYGSAPEIHSQLMNAMTWSEDYYRKISSIALMTVLRALCDFRDKTGDLFHLGHVYKLLNEPLYLRVFNEKLLRVYSSTANDIILLAEKLDRPSEREKLTGLIANLNLLIYSSAGELLTTDAELGASYDFNEAINEKRISYFLMNSLKLKESAKIIGKIILQDLMRFVGDRYAHIHRGETVRPITLIIDEFASFAIPEFIEFMDRARGAGIGIIIAHQSRADLREISPEFQERIEANSNTIIVSGKQSPEDAEYYASMLGTRTVKKETVQMKDEVFFDSPTGVKSIRETEEFVVHPNQIKELRQGRVLTISRTIDPQWGLINVPQAPEVNSMHDREYILEEIREQYTANKNEIYLKLELTKPKVASKNNQQETKTIEKIKPVLDQKESLWD